MRFFLDHWCTNFRLSGVGIHMDTLAGPCLYCRWRRAATEDGEKTKEYFQRCDNSPRARPTLEHWPTKREKSEAGPSQAEGVNRSISRILKVSPADTSIAQHSPSTCVPTASQLFTLLHHAAPSEIFYHAQPVPVASSSALELCGAKEKEGARH